jgi:phage tail sheath protein FI
MATSYLAPGVYVEEVPSAVQSIAGVGTNTVGFIGLFDEDKIEYPQYKSDADYQKELSDKYLELYGKDGDYAKANVDAKIAAAAGDKRTKEAALDAASRALRDAKAQTKKSQAAVDAAADAAGKAAAQPALEADAKDEKKKADIERDARTEAEGARKALADFEELGKQPETARRKAARALTRQAARAQVQRHENKPFTVHVPVGEAKLCTNFSEYQSRFGRWSAYTDEQLKVDSNDDIGLTGHQALSHAVFSFFNNGGTRAFVTWVHKDNADELNRALENFESIESISLIACPGASADKSVSAAMVAHCEKTQFRFAILDAPQNPVDKAGQLDFELLTFDSTRTALPSPSKHAALYFPYIQVVDPALQIQQANDDDVPSKYKGLVNVPPSGAMAGIYARTDNQRGVFKAPANMPVLGARNVQYYIGRSAQEGLNPQGVNCIRTIDGAITVYGARTLGGDQNFEWRYVPVRRTFLYLAKSIDAGTQWVVFEPNDIALWGKVKRNLSAFLTTQWRNGMLFGATPEEAFYVKCDAENNPPDTREAGQLIIEIGVAIVRPAEFVIIRITQGTAKTA